MNEQSEPIRYSMIIEWDPRDDIFVVTVPELNGCRTHGRSYEEAIQQGQDAIESWIDAMRHWGDEIPPPRTYDDERWPWAERASVREVARAGN
jgi:predicted RNase H-like HicB family nuclease